VKIKNKLPQYNERLHFELIKNEWVPMKEPKHLISAIFLSIPLMIINALISVGIINMLSTVSLKDFGIEHQTDSILFTINLGIIFFIILLVILHELLHLIFIPHFIKSKNTFIGLTLLGGFVATEEKISKSRYILITIAPFIIISVILPLILGFFGVLTSTLKFLIILNSMSSSVDILNLLLIIKQVPNNGILKSNGHKTYWNNKQTDFKF
jgi:Putative zincin peptidase